ncbi:hypothetical protein [uncultured Prevotella sp.]|uniref:hypothetical protein n=1 Tax=uncultured Prevotella sp. TaxID=159272 RepID=UPI0025944A95|nr:hypothetical protein [uncultured Prevotella sp.]
MREIDMESLLTTSQSGNAISGDTPTTGLGGLGGSTPSVGDSNDGTHPVGASQNLWSEEEE